MIWNVVKIANESGMNEITFDQKYRRFNKKKAVNQDLRLNERSSFFCLHGESTKMYNSLRKLTSTTGSNKTNSKRQHPTIGHRDHARCYWPRYLTWLREWDKNFGKLLTIAWLASSVCSSWNAVWSVWNKPLLKSQNVNQAVNHKSAFWSFYCYLGQPDCWFHEKITADPIPRFVIPHPVAMISYPGLSEAFDLWSYNLTLRPWNFVLEW